MFVSANAPEEIAGRQTAAAAANTILWITMGCAAVHEKTRIAQFVSDIWARCYLCHEKYSEKASITLET